jgi:hypothetical protein
VGRQTDDRVGTQNAPGQRDRGIVLADVHPVSPDGQRQVGPVVEHERDTGVLTDVAHHGGPGEQRAGFEVLVPQLHHVDAARDAGRDEIGQVGPVRSAEIEMAGREVEGGAHAEACALAFAFAFAAFLAARTLAIVSASVMSATER